MSLDSKMSSKKVGTQKKKKKTTEKKTAVEATTILFGYLHKVRKQVHPNIVISNKAMLVMNSFVTDIFERIATEGKTLLDHVKFRQPFVFGLAG
jgi:histone H2B